ncbi:colicin immunity domain-containing protein [Streptomyces sp. NPDC007984]|uniref:colicin immunity domain-containing protein n=1 Tax=Streptomyces sp. NPDC007984 TaxID=3364801 RepID=UPI0036EE8DFC
MTELFIVGKIDALEFESKFWSEFHGLREISDKDFAVLNELFYVVEDFVADVTARDLEQAFLNACRRL